MLALIRSRCQPLHDQLHHHPLLASLGDASLTRERLSSILRAFYAVYNSLEGNRTAKAPEGVPDAPAVAWLEADLKMFGGGRRIDLPDNVNLPPIDSLSSLFGYLYVKQGSTLGGQVISKHLAKTLSIAENENHFFRGYGVMTGPNWKRFVQEFEAASPLLDPEITATTAVAVFEAIDKACTAAHSAEKELVL